MANPSKYNKQSLLNSVQAVQLKPNVPDFVAGDQVSVAIRLIENKKTRIQKFNGVVLRRRGSGLSETVIVRKDSDGVGIEKSFLIHSPLIWIELKRKGRVRRAYISYMRERSGKAARIKEKTREQTRSTLTKTS